MVKAGKTDTRSSLSIRIPIEIQRNYSSFHPDTPAPVFHSSLQQRVEQTSNPQSVSHLWCIWCSSNSLKCNVAFGFVWGDRAHSYRQPIWKVHSSVHDKTVLLTSTKNLCKSWHRVWGRRWRVWVTEEMGESKGRYVFELLTDHTRTQTPTHASLLQTEYEP